MSRLHDGGRRVASTARRLWQRDAGRCGRCGDPIPYALPWSHPDGLTIGHIVAQSRGGSDSDSNLRPEHNRCNLSAKAGDAPRTIASPIAAVVAEPVSFGAVTSRKRRAADEAGDREGLIR